MYDVEIAELPARRVIGIGHRGPYGAIGAAFERLGAAVAEGGLEPEAKAFLGVFVDDPGRVPEADLRSLAGIEVRDDLALPEGFEEERLPAGRYAILHHVGPYSGLPAAWGWLVGEWLAGSGVTPRAVPASEVYLDGPGEAAPEAMRTDLCLGLV
jgi:AraC family transcriptional regulator